MFHDLGWKEDSSGYPTYDNGCPDSQGRKTWGRGGQSSRDTLWIDREERKRHSRWRVLCTKVGRRKDIFRRRANKPTWLFEPRAGREAL